MNIYALNYPNPFNIFSAQNVWFSHATPKNLQTLQFSSVVQTQHVLAEKKSGFHMQHQTLRKPYNSVPFPYSSGLLWAAPGCSGLLWAALGSSGLLWAALDCFGLLWAALGGSGRLRAAFGLLWAALDCSVLLWAALGCSGNRRKSHKTHVKHSKNKAKQRLNKEEPLKTHVKHSTNEDKSKGQAIKPT